MVAGPFSRGALAGENVATAMAFDHDGDYGVFNVSTLEAARAAGAWHGAYACHVHDAAERALHRKPAVQRARPDPRIRAVICARVRWKPKLAEAPQPRHGAWQKRHPTGSGPSTPYFQLAKKAEVESGSDGTRTRALPSQFAFEGPEQSLTRESARMRTCPPTR
jgi:hypothetical protein